MSGKIRDIFNKVIDWLSGDVVLKRGWDRKLGFVIYLFVLIIFIIGWSLTVEQNLVKVRQNEKTIQELKIAYKQEMLDIVSMNNRTKVDGLLRSSGSQLHAPTEPPRRIERKK